MIRFKRANQPAAPRGAGRIGLTALAGVLVLAGCNADDERAGTLEAGRAAEVAGAASSWIMPPSVSSVQAEGAELVVSGRADPGGRVVLRTPDGRAYAAVADTGGRFEIRTSATEGVVLTPEAQLGQEAVPAVARLLILDAVSAQAVLLSPGAASTRLGASPALSSIDHDGRAVILSGRGAPNSEIVVEVGGRGPARLTTDAAGGWQIGLEGLPPTTVQIGTEVFSVPPLGGDRIETAPGTVDRQEREGGTLLRWQTPDGAPQTTWLPRR